MGKPFEKLLEPIKIGEVEIKNRIAMAPMGMAGLLNSNLAPGPRLLDYYLERARGGVGLIITGLFKVENEVEHFQGVFTLMSSHALAPLTELAEAVHSLGTKIFVQLTAGFGRVAASYRLEGNSGGIGFGDSLLLGPPTDLPGDQDRRSGTPGEGLREGRPDPGRSRDRRGRAPRARGLSLRSVRHRPLEQKDGQIRRNPRRKTAAAH